MISKRTGASKNARRELLYIEPKNNKPHKNTNGITKRNLLVTGFNCRTDTPVHTYRDFKYHIQQSNKYHHIKNQTYDFVISSSQGDFDPNNKEDVFRFSQFAKGFTKRAFAKPPKNVKQSKMHPASADKLNSPQYPILIAIQADNTRGILHAHVIVCNSNIYNGRALPSKFKNIYNLRRANDEEVRSYNSKFKDKKIYDLSKNYKRNPTPRQKSIAELLHKCMNNPKVNSVSKVRAKFKQNGITFSTRRPTKKKYKGHRGVVFRIQNGKEYKTKNGKRSNKNNKKTNIKLSSISWVYKKAYGTSINYGMIKHNLALKRMGKFKPIRDTKATSTSSAPTTVASSSVVKSSKSASTNDFVMQSQLSKITSGFTHNGIHNHSHNHTNHWTESKVDAANTRNFKPTRANTDNEPQIQYNYNQSLASSESETNDTPVHIKFNYKDKQAEKWIKITWPVGNLKKRTKKVGEDYWWWKPINFSIPYFNNNHLESLINRYEESGNDEDKQDLDNFQSKCDYDDKQAINTRLARDSSYYKAEASINDVKRDIHKLHMAQKRGFGFSR